METLNVRGEEQEGLESFIHRNTKTEISNFEGSFRPCLFSRIDSSSSFESSFENYTENFSECIKEERPLSKSYKPESVLKASFLTDERNSPSFREFESTNSKTLSEEAQKQEINDFKHDYPKDLFKFDDFSKYYSQQKLEGLSTFKEIGKFPELKEIFSRDSYDDHNMAKEVVKLTGIKDIQSGEISKQKLEADDKYLAFIDHISKKEEEIKGYIGKLLAKDKEIYEIKSKSSYFQNMLEEISKEKEQLIEQNEKLQSKLEKCENQLITARNAHFELQKEANKLASRATKEDRIRKVPDDIPLKNDKIESRLKELLSENEYLKQELQKRPSFNQYQSTISRIEELEGLLSKRSNHKYEKNDIIKSILEQLRLDDPSQIIPTIRATQNSKGKSKLLARISSLIKDCAPPGTFTNEPTPRDIWKFIRNVMEGYLKLKKNENNIIVSKLQGCLGIGENGNVYQEVMKIYSCLHFMEIVFDKIKAKLGLSPHATLKEVEIAIEDI